MEPWEMLDTYLDQNDMHCWESSSGLKNLNTLCSHLGYSEQSYKNGSPLEEFLSDNPGACSAVVDFIRDHMIRCEEWQTALESHIQDEEDEED